LFILFFFLSDTVPYPQTHEILASDYNKLDSDINDLEKNTNVIDNNPMILATDNKIKNEIKVFNETKHATPIDDFVINECLPTQINISTPCLEPVVQEVQEYRKVAK